MRDIKFRAWDKINKKWLQSSDICIEGINGLLIIGGRGRPLLYELMQYTGLKDKNGKEIYEGDIVACKFNPHYVQRISWQGKPDAVAEVIWDLCTFRLHAIGEKDRRYADFVDLNREQSKIIGNIYENPELLK